MGNAEYMGTVTEHPSIGDHSGNFFTFIISMGNAGCTLHHPTSLEATVPFLDAGHMVDPPGIGILRFEKNAGAAFGVGGRVVFKKNVRSSEHSMTHTDSVDTKLSLAGNATPGANLEVGYTETDAEETKIETQISDDSKYSELYFYVEYNDKDKDGQLRWNKNDLNLGFEERWDENSELTITVTFAKPS